MLSIFAQFALVGSGLAAGAWSFYIVISSIDKASLYVIGKIKSIRHHSEN